MSLAVLPMGPKQVRDPPGPTPWLARRGSGVRPAGSDPIQREGLQGRHVLGAVLSFFAAIFVMNGALIYAAVSTNSGLVANEPYRKGLYYNKRIAADERQAQLGWTDTLEVTRDGVALMLKDSGGQPVTGLKVEAVLGRPATNREDIRLAVREVAPGRYEAQTAPLAPGTWLVALEARGDGEEPIYRKRRRVWSTP
jgi:nitrogen fixation protein FixH